MECIICLTDGSEPLQENQTCPCNYKRHNTCWVDYVHSVAVVKCPMCRHVLSQPLPPTRKPRIPTVVSTNPIHTQRDVGESISYHQFVEIVRAATEAHERQEQEQQRQREEQVENRKMKKAGAILLVAAIACIVILIVFKVL
jgi:hypothetical protein